MKSYQPAPGIFTLVIIFCISVCNLNNTHAQLPVPEAISITPTDASAADTITLTLDIRKACLSEKSLPFTGAEEIYMSGGAIRPHSSRSNMTFGVYHPQGGADGSSSIMNYNGDSTYSIRFQPAGFFGATGVEIKGLSLAFADFDQTRQAFDDSPFGCTRFYVPLKPPSPVMDTIIPGVTIEIEGLISENTVLDFDTVRIIDRTVVDMGVTLTIQPGTYFEFADQEVLRVYGTLIAEGTEEDSILFTAQDPVAGCEGFWFYNQIDLNESKFSYCRFWNMKTDHDWNGALNATYYPRLSISHSILHHNMAHAINLINSSISVDHTTISDNSKGGVHSYASNATFLNCRIINNNSHGMYLNLSDPLILNSIISNNGGRGLQLHAGDPVIINSILAKNGERSIWMEISNPKFINSIMWDNQFDMDMTDPTSSMLVKNSILPTQPQAIMDRMVLSGINHFDADPKFIDPPADIGINAGAYSADWRVPINSPAVNGGTTHIEGFTIPEHDLGGNLRIAYGYIDIGPYEFHQGLSTLVINADVDQDTVWMADTVKIENDILVQGGVTLTISPGTIVEFQGHYEMTIEGRLIAVGGEGSEIRFTIHDTAGYYDLDTTLGTWGGLNFNTNGYEPSQVRHCIFEYAAAMNGPDRRGGAINISDWSSPEQISNCLFQYNYAEQQGGAICINWASTRVTNSEFRNNLSYEGGAIYTSTTSSATIEDNYIHHNKAWAYGGGIYSSGAAIIQGNRVAYNEAYNQGGGIYCRKSKARILANIIHNNRYGGIGIKNCDPVIASNLIVNNAADAPLGDWHIRREGSGLFIDINSDAIIFNNTIANNLSSQFKGSVVRLYSDTKFINNIVWGNGDDFGNAAPIAIEGAISADILNCIVQGGRAAIRAENYEYNGLIEQIIDSLPQFIDPSDGPGIAFDGYAGDWDIYAISPAINNGTSTEDLLGDAGDLISDYLGNQRNPEEVDIGAYEHQAGELQIGSQPVDIVACDGDSVRFSVVANDTAYFQWYRDEKPLPGANNPVLKINPVDQPDEGIYFCIVRNAYGQKHSAPSFLIVNHPPEVFVQPENSWMIEGTQVKLEVFAEGSPPMDFTWYKNGDVIPDVPPLPKFTIPNPDTDDEGKYNCIIENMCGSASTDSIQLYLAPQICMVTIDTATGDNLIIWEKKTQAPVASYNVYRESIVKGEYEVLANVPVDSLSVFTDTSANPAEQAYIYKITALDAEGNESDIRLCRPHKTIHLLTSYNTESNTAQLDWDEYYGFQYGTYFIYRSQNKSSFSKVKDISASFKTWLDTDAEENTVYYYRVAVAKTEPCSPTRDGKKAGTGPYSHALSNMDDNKLKSTTSIDSKLWYGSMTIWPNPMQDEVWIRFPNPRSSEYTMLIRDLSGKLVRSVSGIRTDEISLERGELRQGYYFIEITGPETHRGKLIVK